jgi:hypothetical protein
MTLFILFKAVSVDPVKAAKEPTQQEMQMRIEQHFRQHAERLGVATEGKTLEDIRKELHVLQEQKRREAIWRKAQQYEITTEGKSMDKVVEEVRAVQQRQLQMAAQKAGISIEGKTVQQIASELKKQSK